MISLAKLGWLHLAWPTSPREEWRMVAQKSAHKSCIEELCLTCESLETLPDFQSLQFEAQETIACYLQIRCDFLIILLWKCAWRCMRAKNRWVTSHFLILPLPWKRRFLSLRDYKGHKEHTIPRLGVEGQLKGKQEEGEEGRKEKELEQREWEWT